MNGWLALIFESIDFFFLKKTNNKKHTGFCVMKTPKLKSRIFRVLWVKNNNNNVKLSFLSLDLSDCNLICLCKYVCFFLFFLKLSFDGLKIGRTVSVLYFVRLFCELSLHCSRLALLCNLYKQNVFTFSGRAYMFLSASFQQKKLVFKTKLFSCCNVFFFQKPKSLLFWFGMSQHLFVCDLTCVYTNLFLS